MLLKCDGRSTLTRGMALERTLAPSILDSHFFDDIFDDVNREICRMHHDLRHGMMRLRSENRFQQPAKQMKNVRDCIVSSDDGSEEFRLNVDLNAFTPEEINVKTKGNLLSIAAKHEKSTDDSTVLHEFSRSFTLPENVDPESLVCSLSRDGVMTIKGPVGAPVIEGPPEMKRKTQE